MNDIEHPNRNLVEEEAQIVAQEYLDFKKEEDSQELNEHDDEVIRRKLKGLAHNLLEKKRGNFYRISKIQYPHKTKRQLEREFIAQQYITKKKVEETLTPDQREENYLQNECESIKQKQADLITSLQADKQQPVSKDDFTPNYATERPYDMHIAQAKKKMIENSQYLSKINFIAAQVKTDKYNKLRKTTYGKPFAALENSSAVEAIIDQKKTLTLKQKAKSTIRLDYDEQPLDISEPRAKYSITPTPNKTVVLPKVQNNRPITSVAENKKRPRYDQTKSTEASFINKSSLIKEAYGGKNDTSNWLSRNSYKTNSRNADSIFQETEVIIDKILAKGNKKSKAKRLSSKNSELTRYTSSNTTISAKTRAFFKEHDSFLDDVSGPIMLTSPFTSLSERGSYNYDPFKVTIPSILIDSQKF